MNVTKAIRMALALSAAAVAQVSCADMLYFQINGAHLDESIFDNDDDVKFSYASVSTDGGETHLNYYVNGAKTEYWQLYANNPDSSGLGTSTEAMYFGDFDSSQVSSFFVELWDEDTNPDADPTRVGWRSYSVAQVATSIWKDGVSGGVGGNAPYAASAVVPEPTSGLLLLLGAAGLALRRRRRA